MGTPRLTKPTIAVLEVLLGASDDEPAWGLRICMEADLGSGTVYPLLERLAKQGWVTSWTESEPHPGRPPRRFYQLTQSGRLAAEVALQERAAKRARFRLAGGVA
ncbi:helix-turn-helix transcriptional regulator [Streptomyces sp. ISL-66]|uniref:PadR family transcriptional regulator n=1 Tax=Streptomyces sp. ISL-66 TaxID=2819186 RepID=UPI001BE6EA11|nr:helix-turn-helix transcriptional regulator [Streptomyces sp. ISL-66]MBT2472579.1 helix-turn-helix transcriptional regulator [Streptomyces sp. ISL-66]